MDLIALSTQTDVLEARQGIFWAYEASSPTEARRLLIDQRFSVDPNGPEEINPVVFDEADTSAIVATLVWVVQSPDKVAARGREIAVVCAKYKAHAEKPAPPSGTDSRSPEAMAKYQELLSEYSLALEPFEQQTLCAIQRDIEKVRGFLGRIGVDVEADTPGQVA